MGDFKIDNPDVKPQQLWYNYGGVAPSVSVQITGDQGVAAVTTINVDTGGPVTGPVITLTGTGSGFTFSAVMSTITLVSPLTTKGDLYTHNSTVGTRLGVGTDGFVLTARSTESTGLKWEAAASGASTDLTNDFLLMGG